MSSELASNMQSIVDSSSKFPEYDKNRDYFKDFWTVF